jgi:CheY-like chemotaxis protein
MQVSGKHERPPVLLLIDDDQVSREVMATVLGLSGFTVDMAVNGEAAVELLKEVKHTPDAILMDAQMPGLSGTALIAELRTRSKARILVISASKPPDEIFAVADGFLLKPFGADELRKVLEAKKGQPRNSASHDPESLLDPNEPVVNPETLAQLRKMMPETGVRQIYAAIVADLGLRTVALEAALTKGDTAEVRRIGHAIKGGCALAGARQAARLGALIESGALDNAGNQLDNSTRPLSDLRAATASLERMLKAEFPL